MIFNSEEDVRAYYNKKVLVCRREPLGDDGKSVICMSRQDKK